MPRITISRTQEEIDAARSALSHIQGGLPSAYSKALNRSAYGSRDDMVQIAREDYNYKVDAVRKRMWVALSSPTKLEAKVESKGGPVHLTDMLETKEIKPYGVWVNVKKSTGPKQIKYAFIAKGRNSGKAIVFRRGRVTDSYASPTLRRQLADAMAAGHITADGRVWRYPIVAMFAPHPEVAWNTDENWGRLSEWANVRMTENFGDEVDAVLDGWHR